VIGLDQAEADDVAAETAELNVLERFADFVLGQRLVNSSKHALASIQNSERPRLAGSSRRRGVEQTLQRGPANTSLTRPCASAKTPAEGARLEAVMRDDAFPGRGSRHFEGQTRFRCSEDLQQIDLVGRFWPDRNPPFAPGEKDKPPFASDWKILAIKLLGIMFFLADLVIHHGPPVLFCNTKQSDDRIFACRGTCMSNGRNSTLFLRRIYGALRQSQRARN